MNVSPYKRFEKAFKEAYLAALLRAGLTEIQAAPTPFGISNASRAVDKAIGEELSPRSSGIE